MPKFYRQEGAILYVLGMFLVAGLHETLPKTGGWFTIADLTTRLDRLFPANLPLVARERLTRRAIEQIYVKAKGSNIPAWIGINLVDNELVCPPHPDTPKLPDAFLLPPCGKAQSIP